MIARKLSALLVPAAVAFFGVAAEERDPKAVAVANEVMKASGGEEGWRAARFLRFTFVYEQDGAVRSSRTHYWDRFENRHRLEMINREGKNVVCVTDLPSIEAACTVDGAALFGKEAKPYAERAHAAWINDTYWLLMPYKMMDPGVNLKYEGEVKEGAKTFDKVQLSFEKVGLTPKDRYWAWIDRGNHRIDRWGFVLQNEKGEPGTGEPEIYAWKGWSQFGKVWLSTEKTSPDGKSRVLFKDVAVFEKLPDEVFSKTSKVSLP